MELAPDNHRGVQSQGIRIFPNGGSRIRWRHSQSLSECESQMGARVAGRKYRKECQQWLPPG